MHGIEGLHHITAIASEPQTHINLYAGVLGVRLVKRTANFDIRPPTTSTTIPDESSRASHHGVRSNRQEPEQQYAILFRNKPSQGAISTLPVYLEAELQDPRVECARDEPRHARAALPGRVGRV